MIANSSHFVNGVESFAKPVFSYCVIWVASNISRLAFPFTGIQRHYQPFLELTYRQRDISQIIVGELDSWIFSQHSGFYC